MDFDTGHWLLNGRRKSPGAKSISEINDALTIDLLLLFLTVNDELSGCFQKSPPVKVTGH